MLRRQHEWGNEELSDPTALIAAKLNGHELYIELMLLRSRDVLQLVFEADLSQPAAETEVALIDVQLE
jgi:hypothetical protein